MRAVIQVVSNTVLQLLRATLHVGHEWVYVGQREVLIKGAFSQNADGRPGIIRY